jgi:hypothetical protein
MFCKFNNSKMKKINYLLGLLLVVLFSSCFTSCSSDDEEDKENKTEQSGAYRLVIEMNGSDLTLIGNVTAVGGSLYDGETDEKKNNPESFFMEDIDGKETIEIYSSDKCMSFNFSFTLHSELDNEEPYSCIVKLYQGGELVKEFNEVPDEYNKITVAYTHVNTDAYQF